MSFARTVRCAGAPHFTQHIGNATPLESTISGPSRQTIQSGRGSAVR